MINHTTILQIKFKIINYISAWIFNRSKNDFLAGKKRGNFQATAAPIEGRSNSVLNWANLYKNSSCKFYSPLAYASYPIFLQERAQARVGAIASRRYYLHNFKNVTPGHCILVNKMSYNFSRNFSLFIDRRHSAQPYCGLRLAGLPYSINENKKKINSLNSNSLFSINKRNYSDSDRPFYETDAFLFGGAGVSSVLLAAYLTYFYYDRRRSEKYYYSNLYDPRKKSPEERYAKDSKFKFKPLKLRPVQEKIRDELIPDDRTYISRADCRERPLDWVEVYKKRRDKVKRYSWPPCTPRKAREYDRMIKIEMECRRMGYEIDLSPVKEPSPSPERTRLVKLIDWLVSKYMKWCLILATLCLLEAIIHQIFFPWYHYSFLGERAFMNQWWNEPFSHFIRKTAESPTRWLRACDYLFWSIHYIAEVAQNVIPHFCSAGHIHWYRFSEPIDSSEAWFGPFQDWRGENGGLERFIRWLNWYWYVLNTSFFVPWVIALVYFGSYCIGCIRISQSEEWLSMFPEDIFVSRARRAFRVFVQLPIFVAVYIILLVILMFVGIDVVDWICDWLQFRDQVFYSQAYRGKIFIFCVIPIVNLAVALFFIFLYRLRVSEMADLKKKYEVEARIMKREMLKEHRILSNRVIREKMRALEDEYDFLESLGNVYDEGPENVKEKNLEAIRIRHVHALIRKRQIANFFEPDTDTWSGKFQKYFPWSRYNKGIKNIELTAEESSALYREQLDLRTLIEWEMREDEKAKLRLELKSALAGYEKLLQKKINEKRILALKNVAAGQSILQTQIENIKLIISNILKAIELEESGLLVEPRTIWNKIKKSKF